MLKTIYYSEYDIKLNLSVKFRSRSLWNVEYSFITITPRSAVTQSVNTC